MPMPTTREANLAIKEKHAARKKVSVKKVGDIHNFR
jgi:hypothetical protein